MLGYDADEHAVRNGECDCVIEFSIGILTTNNRSTAEQVDRFFNQTPKALTAKTPRASYDNGPTAQ